MNLLKRIGALSVLLPAFAFALVVAALFGNKVSAEDAQYGAGVTISPAINSVELAPGETYKGEMKVTNNSKIAMSYEISTGNYTIVNNDYSAPNYEKSGKYSLMKDWTTATPKTLNNLQPGESRTVTYIIKVPSNPPAGTQYATVFASTINNEKLKTTGIQSIARAGLVVTANMKGGKTVDRVTILDQNIPGYQPAAPLTSTFKVKNEGNIAASTTYSMKITSWLNGRTVYEDKSISSGVYPETTRAFDLKWEDSRIGIYNVEQKVKVNGRDYSIKKVVVAIPIWIIILVILAIVCMIVFTIINVKAAHDAKNGNKAKSTAKKSSRRTTKR